MLYEIVYGVFSVLAGVGLMVIAGLVGARLRLAMEHRAIWRSYELRRRIDA